jgi:YebC/PmpR family DNA-binding regulatory protein
LPAARADADGSSYEHVSYEGYGPAGVAVFVEALTDNRNRTASEVRHIFTRSDGSLGESGSVAWLFERTGVVVVAAEGVDEDELMMAAAEGGADDVTRDSSVFQVTCPPEALASVRAALGEAGIEAESAQLAMLPKTTVTIEDEGLARRIVRLMEALEDNDDVQDVYANFDIPEAVLEAAAE